MDRSEGVSGSTGALWSVGLLEHPLLRTGVPRGSVGHEGRMDDSYVVPV